MSPAYYGPVKNQTGNAATIQVLRFAQPEASGTIRVHVKGGQSEPAEGRVRARTGEEVNVSFRR